MRNKAVAGVPFVASAAAALAEPFRQTYSYRRHRDLARIGFVCADDDRNPVDANGDTGYVQPN